MSALRNNGNHTKKGKILPSSLNTKQMLSGAKECTSTPIELLVEFLFSVMTKDYEKALNYCTRILSYEPNNTTVRKFYPLIKEKLEMKKLEDCSSESSESYSSDSSISSENNLSDDEIINTKSSDASSERYKSCENNAIGEISDCLLSNLTTSETKTKNEQMKPTEVRKIVSTPLKERNSQAEVERNS